MPPLSLYCLQTADIHQTVTLCQPKLSPNNRPRLNVRQGLELQSMRSSLNLNVGIFYLVLLKQYTHVSSAYCTCIMSEKFALKWNGYQAYWNKSLPLECAHKREIEGLTGQESVPEKTDHDGLEEKVFPADEDEIHYERREEDIFLEDKDKHLESFENREEITTQRQYARTLNRAGPKIDVTTLTPEEIKEKIEELYGKIDGMWFCMVCEYTSTHRPNVKKHVEKHMEGLSYSCNFCHKEFRSVNN